MKKQAEIISHVSDGKLSTEAREAISRLLRLANGKKVKVTIQQVKRRRSNPQNAYYWGVVIPAILEMWLEAGNHITEEGLHDYLKGYVGDLVEVVVTPKGERKAVLGSTAALGTIEFEEYLEKCRAWAAEMGCVIPLPNEEGAYNYEHQ